MTTAMRDCRFFINLLLALLISGTLSTAVLAGDVVRIGGAGSGLGAVRILGEAFEKAYPGTKIKVLPSLGSAGGIKALLHGALDVAISGRALNAVELKEGAAAVEYARTPFIFMANKNVTTSNLTHRELEMIYQGELQKWPDGTRIRLVIRPPGDTDTTIVKNISTAMEKAVNAASNRRNMIIAVTDQEAADIVAKTPGALGGTTLSQTVTEHYPVKTLSFNGIKPTLAALARGSYPLSKPLYLVTAPKTSATAMQFVQFARSAKGRAILAQSGCIPTADGKRTK